MFSYRHSFHAGNHADVLKHLSQMILINKLKSKDKGFIYFDTHSGAGVYQLDSAQARKTNEFKQGIERAADYGGSNQNIIDYLRLMAAYQEFNQYPGSPEIAKSLLRSQDEIVCMEWHNQEIQLLKRNLNARNINIHHRDGFEGLMALTPPNKQRGLVLIDPPYEVADEYDQVVQAVSQVYRKWNTAIYAIWYPILSDRTPTDQPSEASFAATSSKAGKSQEMLQQLKAQNYKNLLNIELRVASADGAAGMVGSGLAVINAPWQFDQQLRAVLQDLCPMLAQDQGATFSVDWLIKD